MIILVSRKKKEVMEFDYGRKANDEVFEKRLNKAFEEAKALIKPGGLYTFKNVKNNQTASIYVCAGRGVDKECRISIEDGIKIVQDTKKPVLVLGTKFWHGIHSWIEYMDSSHQLKFKFIGSAFDIMEFFQIF